MSTAIEVQALDLVLSARDANLMGAILGLLALDLLLVVVCVVSRRHRWVPAVVMAGLLYLGDLGILWAMGIGAGTTQYVAAMPWVMGLEQGHDGRWDVEHWQPGPPVRGGTLTWDVGLLRSVQLLGALFGPCARCEQAPSLELAEAQAVLDAEGTRPWLVGPTTMQVGNGGQYPVFEVDMDQIRRGAAALDGQPYNPEVHRRSWDVMALHAFVGGPTWPYPGGQEVGDPISNRDLHGHHILRAAEVRPGLLVIETHTGRIELRRWDAIGPGRLYRTLR